VTERAIIERIAQRYESRWLRGYTRGKLRSDPVYRVAFEHLRNTRLPITDIGCGIGLFAFYLRERGCDAPVLGLDCDAWKIATAQGIAAAHTRDVNFAVKDALEGGRYDGHVVIFDVLHYFDADAQTTLLQQIADQIPPGGTCIIRDTLQDGSWRFTMTLLGEWLGRAVRWMPAVPVCFFPIERVVAPFVARGFRADVRPCWGRTPFNGYLFVFEKPEPAAG
jgi:2-polyprenyl-3-methyl-5-hydroxy-6-metoxy-1,4-benzoquinol methylase